MQLEVNNGFLKNNYFDNKNILIIVPHQDDEINVAGGILSSISNENVRVLYTTNGDFCMPAEIRYKEAIKSLKKLGIKKENAIFMGYSDQPYDQSDHLYNTNGIWNSKHYINKTYGANNIKEWCYNKHKIHQSFTKENFKNDIKEVIEQYRPDLIIAIDNDFHPDHIATSLSFEQALGEILNKEDNNYYPVVLKTFAYENSYLGRDDFNQYNTEEMKFDAEEGNLINNVYYNESEAIKIPLSTEAYNINLNKNKIWKAIKQHKSQLLVEHAFRIINTNNVYWKRRTDNLLNKAKVLTSSSNAKFLHDFLLCDSNYILNGNKKKINYNEAIWIPTKEDKEKKIDIIFNNKEYVKYLKLYHGLLNKNHIKNIEITINDTDTKKYLLGGKNIEVINIGEVVTKITIKVLDEMVNNGFSEIEALGEEKNDINIIKAIIDDKWTNNFITKSTTPTQYKITTYSYNSGKDIEIDATNLKNGKCNENTLVLTNKSKGYIILSAKNNKELYDIVHINKNKFKYKINIILNHFKIKISIFLTKVYRKLFISYRYCRKGKNE